MATDFARRRLQEIQIECLEGIEAFLQPLVDLLTDVRDFQTPTNDYQVFAPTVSATPAFSTFDGVMESVLIDNETRFDVFIKLDDDDEFKVTKFSRIIFDNHETTKVEYRAPTGSPTLQIIGLRTVFP